MANSDEIQRALIIIQEELSRIAPIREGMHDYLRLDLTLDAQAEIKNAGALYDRRWTQLKAGEAALEALLKPFTLPHISPDVHKDLSDQITTMTAALQDFPIEAAVIAIEWTTPEEQPKE